MPLEPFIARRDSSTGLNGKESPDDGSDFTDRNHYGRNALDVDKQPEISDFVRDSLVENRSPKP